MLQLSFRILIFSILMSSCNSQTMVDIYRENLALKIDGVVEEVELYKGGGIQLSIKNTEKVDVIGLNNKFFKSIQKGDYFIKNENSNECIVRRKDSIIYLDCYDIPADIRDSLGVINEWPKIMKGFWMKQN